MLDKDATKILIKDLKLFGHHGYYPQEREAGQLFAIDLELEGDFSEEELEKTADWGAVIKTIKKINESSSFQLIEGFANRIAQAILDEFPPVGRVNVRVKKLNLPLRIGWVAVEVSRVRREDK
jgi:dihydroneopterin aldolase